MAALTIFSALAAAVTFPLAVTGTFTSLAVITGATLAACATLFSCLACTLAFAGFAVFAFAVLATVATLTI
ncbi:MAG: hypothetical protein HZB62_04240 [Nitrospirae bacterium]|nr:hypothetical protein [Nitrospirota bacterium]